MGVGKPKLRSRPPVMVLNLAASQINGHDIEASVRP